MNAFKTMLILLLTVIYAVPIHAEDSLMCDSIKQLLLFSSNNFDSIRGDSLSKKNIGTGTTVSTFQLSSWGECIVHPIVDSIYSSSSSYECNILFEDKSLLESMMETLNECMMKINFIEQAVNEDFDAQKNKVWRVVEKNSSHKVSIILVTEDQPDYYAIFTLESSANKGYQKR